MSDPVRVVATAPSAPMPALAATAFLHVWLDLALNDPAGQPVFCPRCRTRTEAVTVGRGVPAWFRVEPCQCLFEIAGGS